MPWSTVQLKVEPVIKHDQFILLRIFEKDSFWWHTIVYGSPKPFIESNLWSSLKALADGIHEPWLIAGDFNAMLDPKEKQGGSKIISSYCAPFQECMSHCHLLDLGFKGNSFTWS